MKKRLKKFLSEMIPVVVGILIALVINSWQQSNSDREFVRKTLTFISSEVEENEIELREKIEEHEVLLDSINFYLEDEEVLIGNLLQKVNGLRVVTIKNTAWRSFLNAKMELIDYELISTLSNIDGTKQAMERQVEKMIAFVYEKSAAGGFNDKLIFQMIIGDLLHLERGLLEDHDYFLDIQKKD